MAKTAKQKTARISDESVKAKTGKSWEQWLSVIDKAGGRNMDHKGIVAFLCERFPDMDGWWVQMVTVGYEQARGLRKKHEKPGGFEVGVSKTLAVPVSAAYKAWTDAKVRRRWLAKDELTIRKATTNKSMRVTWSGGRTSLSVNFYAKGDAKSQVVVQHGKLATERDASRMKTFWGKTLQAMKDTVEGR